MKKVIGILLLLFFSALVFPQFAESPPSVKQETGLSITQETGVVMPVYVVERLPINFVGIACSTGGMQSGYLIKQNSKPIFIYCANFRYKDRWVNVYNKITWYGTNTKTKQTLERTEAWC